MVEPKSPADRRRNASVAALNQATLDRKLPLIAHFLNGLHDRACSFTSCVQAVELCYLNASSHSCCFVPLTLTSAP